VIARSFPPATLLRKGTGMRQLLERAGFRVRGKRARCVHCTGRDQLTVSFTAEVAYCHRCHWTANAAQLAKSQGRTVAPRKVGLARERKRRFFDWLDKRYAQIAKLEYSLSKRAALAHDILIRFPDCEPAWAALARLEHSSHAIEVFFEAARDKIGRLQLYRVWRRYNV
jgi:G:T-mismatch repair DNA endonuclease (very short patch repair protein)